MTVIDERARVPSLDGSARQRLVRALNREGVVAAALIGSQARRDIGPLSDVDIGVWHAQELGPRAQLQLRLELAESASIALGTGEVDVVLLNEATPLMRHRAIRDGQKLVDRDPAARVRLQAKAIVDYLDTAPLRAELARGQRHRIDEDRFGRRREH